MLKSIAVFTLVSVALVFPGEAATTNVTVRTFGIDGMSCGDWMASPMQMRDGRAFVLGYWSASNRLNAKHPDVGARANTEDILGAVYNACNTGKIGSLPEAAAETYRSFEKEGR
ncbi:MAG TPA: hypothetical protein VGI89_00355 [Rhizomicrobium sp.]